MYRIDLFLSSYIHITSYVGNKIIFAIPREIKRIMKLKTPADKFDSLFALTYLLKSEDYWLHDNECYEKGGALEVAIKLIGNLSCQDVRML